MSDEHIPKDQATILIVDDDVAVRDLAMVTLTTVGYRCMAAEGVDQASEILASEVSRIDAVLTDIAMPGKTGFDLAVHVPFHPSALDKVNDALPARARCADQLGHTRTKPLKRRGEVKTPQSNDPTSMAIVHSKAKPRKELPPTSRKSALNLPVIGSRQWTPFV